MDHPHAVVIEWFDIGGAVARDESDGAAVPCLKVVLGSIDEQLGDVAG